MGNIERFWEPKNEKEKEFRSRVDDFFSGELEVDNPDSGMDDSDEMKEMSEVLISTHKFANNTDPERLHELYEWYANAMRRRNREPLEQDRFENHFFGGMSTDETFMYGTDKQGYLFGFEKGGVFIPTHFAPRSLRGGYSLLKELSENKEIPVVLAVTKDLADTIQKMPGWNRTGITFPSWFRDQVETKEIVFNSHPEVMERSLKLLNEFKEEADLRFGDHDHTEENEDSALPAAP